MFLGYRNQSWTIGFRWVNIFFNYVFHAPFRFDRDKNGGEIMLYVREDSPAKVLSHNFPSTESFFVEIIFHKKKWFINSSCNTNNNNIKIILKQLVEH